MIFALSIFWNAFHLVKNSILLCDYDYSSSMAASEIIIPTEKDNKMDDNTFYGQWTFKKLLITTISKTRKARCAMKSLLHCVL